MAQTGTAVLKRTAPVSSTAKIAPVLGGAYDKWRGGVGRHSQYQVCSREREREGREARKAILV